VVLAVLALGLLAVRRRVLARRHATFDCSLRLTEAANGKGWVLGVAAYADDALEWYRVFSYATRPRHVMARRELEIVDRRVPEGAEVFSLLSGAVIVRCREGGGTGSAGESGDSGDIVEFAMGDAALTGFLAWLESAPPSQPA